MMSGIARYSAIGTSAAIPTTRSTEGSARVVSVTPAAAPAPTAPIAPTAPAPRAAVKMYWPIANSTRSTRAIPMLHMQIMRDVIRNRTPADRVHDVASIPIRIGLIATRAKIDTLWISSIMMMPNLPMP
jgi:hypothetical protein